MAPSPTLSGSPMDALVGLPALPGVPSLASTLGAVLLGSVFGFMLYVLMLHQTYRYYRMYPGDSLALKGLVFIIVAMETFHTALWIIICYEYLINNYFNPFNLIETHWRVTPKLYALRYIKLTIPVTAITGTFSQIFYAGRIYYIGPQYRPIVAAAVTVMLLSLGWDFAATVKVFHAATIFEFSHWTWIISVAYGMVVLCDLINATALIVVLRRSRTGVKRTDTVIDTLVLYTVNTGLLTTIVSSLVFAFALAYPDNLIYGALSIPGVKLYSNSVLALLNSRRALSERMKQGLEDDSDWARPPTLETWNVRHVPISLPVTIDMTGSLGIQSDIAKVLRGGEGDDAA
ncbi:uncharacterized protein TRAVEDRAFT_75272 [Trametes versicolor FP-101664 SS1]|uniref:uncharacterized protein n=1 Tax=Trametes versicolor (strain FP-101664) TaxID=717944 RepID=UPI0004621C92|nr:uncharacterized protein TRAVEDRAFT_75272 [Trametes versicolor FP-101664 SS1]EIW52182.1 hypothetical protein TRAVEDRAFT_75272 [Trametes versicolor FP-101664 SS1]